MRKQLAHKEATIQELRKEIKDLKAGGRAADGGGDQEETPPGELPDGLNLREGKALPLPSVSTAFAATPTGALALSIPVTFLKPGSIGLAFAPKDKKVMVARVRAQRRSLSLPFAAFPRC